ncbi:hypothetical protein B0T22DRAFT_534528 [Podospora appendiculata]|uniref:Protein kinase domain-containing protein n=1 Tax=Podospora appendiculata TaxID=314037 RepID=A0AAE1CIH0_9PEZI|nr:hypothetical protein B0T22DRAFT_534528 [Podospora appendiculata]
MTLILLVDGRVGSLMQLDLALTVFNIRSSGCWTKKYKDASAHRYYEALVGVYGEITPDPALLAAAKVDLETELYRHPERAGIPTAGFRNKHDIYTIGVVLFEIGLRKALARIFPSPQTLRSGEPACQMGARYSEIVQRCLETDMENEGDEESGENTDVGSITQFRWFVIPVLTSCDQKNWDALPLLEYDRALARPLQALNFPREDWRYFQASDGSQGQRGTRINVAVDDEAW